MWNVKLNFYLSNFCQMTDSRNFERNNFSELIFLNHSKDFTHFAAVNWNFSVKGNLNLEITVLRKYYFPRGV